MKGYERTDRPLDQPPTNGQSPDQRDEDSNEADPPLKAADPSTTVVIDDFDDFDDFDDI